VKLAKFDARLKMLIVSGTAREDDAHPVIVAFEQKPTDAQLRDLATRGVRFASVLGRRATATLSASSIRELSDADYVASISLSAQLAPK